MIAQDKTRMSAAEFFDLPETNTPTELLERELIVSPAPTPRHQDVVGELYNMLRDLIPHGKAYLAPIDLYLDDDNVPQPDIVWVAEGGRCRVTEKRLEGPPTLIVEVFSPGSIRRDRDAKFDLYERHGVDEYWIVEASAEFVEVYRFENGRYLRQGAYGAGEPFESAALGGKVVDMARVFATSSGASPQAE
ncbi:MAG: Uma2 family endonuclease [Anaerolineae bacterium]|nr:Uma2 family endonuclease [Anaerolineae bacterium]